MWSASVLDKCISWLLNEMHDIFDSKKQFTRCQSMEEAHSRTLKKTLFTNIKKRSLAVTTTVLMRIEPEINQIHSLVLTGLVYCCNLSSFPMHCSALQNTCSHTAFTQGLLNNMPHMGFFCMSTILKCEFSSLLQDFCFCTGIHWSSMFVLQIESPWFSYFYR